MSKEKFYQKDASTRRAAVSLKFKLWKFFGFPIFHHIPFNALRINLLRMFGAHIGDNTYISRHATIIYPYLLDIGENCSIDLATVVRGKFMIKNNVSIASCCILCNTGHDVRSRAFTFECGENIIESGVFVGMGSFVLKANIGIAAVVGANSFVTKDVPANSIVYGNPAVVKGTRLPQDEFEKYTFD